MTGATVSAVAQTASGSGNAEAGFERGCAVCGVESPL